MTAPTGWQIRPLSEVVSIQRGFDLPHHARRPGSFPVLTSGETGGFHDEGPIKGPGIAIGRATNLGQPKWSDGDFWPHNTTMFVKDFMGNLPRWVFHFFENTDLAGYDSGSVQPMLNRNYIAHVPVLVPPIGEQRAIAEVLGAIDDKISANTKIAATTDELLAAKFAALSEAETDEVRLGDIADVNVETVKATAGGQLRYIDIASLDVGSFNFPPLTDWDTAPSRARRRVKRGDTIWSTVRPNRRSHALNLSDDSLLVGSTGLAVLSPRTVGFAYLYEITKTPEFTAYLETVAEGSAYPAVRADRFSEAPVLLLCEEARSSFEALAKPLRESAHALEVENRTLAATRDTLLPQLMSGKLRVKDAEKVLEVAGV
jgi:type I restriction enzyme S subunit